MNTNNLIERVLLLMKYNNEMTLTENTVVISEQIPNQRLNSSDNVAQGVSQTNYKTANDYCNRGTIKDLQWENDSVNGKDTYQGKKGYCRLSDSKQKVLFDSLGVSYSLKPNGGFFPVTNQNQWYAVYALYVAQQIESFKSRNIWNDDPNGKCKGTGVLSMMVRYNTTDISLQDAFEDRKKRRLICYNNDISDYKPYNQINLNNLLVSSGKVSNNSIPRYKGYIPSYSDIIKAYGWQGNYGKIIAGLNENKDAWYISGNITNRGDKLATKPGTGLENLDVHDLLTILQIGSFFIPIIGPFLSLGIGLGDAAIYYNEGEKGMAALVAGFSFLFDIPGVKTVFKEFAEGGIKALTKEELENIASATLNQNFKTLSKKEQEFLLKIKNNWTTTKEGLENFAKEKSNSIINDPSAAGKLSTTEKNALEKYAKNSVKFDKPLQVAGISGAAAIGAEEARRISGKYDENWNKNIKSIIEDEGFKWDSVKKVFGSSGSSEDNTKLKNAWLNGWRPGDKVPQKYQTKLYTQNLVSRFEKSLSSLSSEDSETPSEESIKLISSLSDSMFKSEESVAKLDSIKTSNLEWAKTNDTGGVPYTGDFNDF
jgi:hypothetical protein